jgi:hypothetical protein
MKYIEELPLKWEGYFFNLAENPLLREGWTIEEIANLKKVAQYLKSTYDQCS